MSTGISPSGRPSGPMMREEDEQDELLARSYLFEEAHCNGPSSAPITPSAGDQQREQFRRDGRPQGDGIRAEFPTDTYVNPFPDRFVQKVLSNSPRTRRD